MLVALAPMASTAMETLYSIGMDILVEKGMETVGREAFKKALTKIEYLKELKKFNIPEEISKKARQELLTLDDKLKVKLPTLTEGQINILKGKIGEEMMDAYFKRSGWSKIEGEVGRNGIDGLYIRRDKDGNIKQVLFAESKYNKSTLGNTNHGKQMSKEWLNKKLDELIKANPENKDYHQIKDLVEKDKYRSRLFQINEEGNKLSIKISKIENPNHNDVKLSDLEGKEQVKINKVKEINLDNPSNKYEQTIIDDYNKIVDNVIKNADKYINV